MLKNVEENWEENTVEEITVKNATLSSAIRKLRMKRMNLNGKQQNNQTQFKGQRSQMTPIQKEVDLYMSYSLIKKGQSI